MALGKALTFTIGAGLGASFGNTFNKIGDTQRKLAINTAKVNKKIAKIDALKKYEKQLARIQKRGRGVGQSTANYVKEQNRLITSISKTKSELKKLDVGLSKIGDSYKKLGKQKRIFETKSKGLGMRSAGISKMKSGIAPIGAAIGSLIMPMKVAIDWETSLAEVQKYVKGIDSNNIKSFGDEIRNVAENSKMTENEVAKLVAAGGRLSLPRKEALKFAVAAEKIGVAFDISAEEAGTMIGKIKASMNLSIPEIAKLGDAINYLGANTASSASNIAVVMQRSGSILKNATNMNDAQIAALAATLDSVAPSSEIAGTAMKNLAISLTMGEKASAGQQYAFQKLGLDAVDMAEMMKNDATGAIQSVLAEIKNLDESEQSSVMASLFGRESLGAISPLLNNLKDFKKTMNSVAKEQNYLGSVQKEYDIQNKTSANKLKKLGGLVRTLGSTIGMALLPVLKVGIGLVVAILKPITWLLDKCPLLTYTIVGLTSGLLLLNGGFKLVTGAKMLFNAQLLLTKANLLTLKSTMLGGFLPAMGTFFMTTISFIWSTTVAMLACPITWIVLGIMAIIGVGFLLVKYWKPIKGFFKSLWSGLVVGVKWCWNIFKKVFSWSPLGLLMRGIGAMFSWLSDKFGGIKGVALWCWDILKTIFSWSPFGLVMRGYGAMFKWLNKKFNIFNKIGSAWRKLKGFFGFGGDKKDDKDNKNEDPRETAIKKATQSAQASSPAAIMSRNNQNSQTNNNQKIAINIKTQKGQSEEKIAELVVQKVQEQNESNQRDSFNDYDSSIA